MSESSGHEENNYLLCLIMQHPFLMGDLTKRQALELLHRVNNPNHMFYDMEPDEDGV